MTILTSKIINQMLDHYKLLHLIVHKYINDQASIKVDIIREGESFEVVKFYTRRKSWEPWTGEDLFIEALLINPHHSRIENDGGIIRDYRFALKFDDLNTILNEDPTTAETLLFGEVSQ